MTKIVISVTPDNGVLHAAQLMLEHHVSGFPVIDDDGVLVGMLTEGDLMGRAELGTAGTPAKNRLTGDIAAREYIRSHSWRVGDLMSANVVSVEETAPIDRIAAVMRTNAIKRVPVLRDGKVIGIISRADILRGIVAASRDNSASGDDAIQRAVSTRLHADLKFDPAVVSVTTSDGNVHLSGQVASETEYKAAQVATETVEGVRGVINDLRVLPAPAAAEEGGHHR